MSVGDFLKGAREQLAKEFREMRAVSVDNLMFVKVSMIPFRVAGCPFHEVWNRGLWTTLVD